MVLKSLSDKWMIMKTTFIRYVKFYNYFEWITLLNLKKQSRIYSVGEGTSKTPNFWFVNPRPSYMN